MRLLSKVYKSHAVVVGEPMEIKEAVPEDVVLTNTGVDLHYEINKKLEKEREYIIKNAKQKAAQTIERAQMESTRIHEAAKEEGYRTGFDKGYKKGLEEGRTEGRQQGLDTARGMIDEAMDLKQSALATKERAIKEAETEIIRIVIEIARKLIGQQIDINEETVLAPVRKALEKCAFSTKVVMKVAREDYEIVEQSKVRLLSEAETISQLEVVAEDTLSRGSCLLETDAGYINSGLEVQLNRIEQAFKELFGYE